MLRSHVPAARVRARPRPVEAPAKTPATRKAPRTRSEALAHVAQTDRSLDRTAAIARDPVRFARAYEDRDDRETAALLCALMAFGNVEVIGKKLTELFRRLDGRPGLAARTWSSDRLDEALKGFVHRTFSGPSIARLLFAVGRVLEGNPRTSTERTGGGLYAPLAHTYGRTGSLRDALSAWVNLLRSHAWPGGVTRIERHLLPDPLGASACKRLLLLCRWISRPDDGVDLGLGALPPRALLIPLDVHVHRVARSLGFTARNAATWQAAEEVTEALRALDRDDPVRFDFALCHAEIAAVRDRRARKSA